MPIYKWQLFWKFIYYYYCLEVASLLNDDTGAGPWLQGQGSIRPGQGCMASWPSVHHSQAQLVSTHSQPLSLSLFIVHCTIPPPCLTPHKQWKQSSSSSSLEKMQHKVSLLLVFLTLNFELDFVNPQRYKPKEVPVFDEHLPSVSTVQQGDTAYLNCRIFHAENM